MGKHLMGVYMFSLQTMELDGGNISRLWLIEKDLDFCQKIQSQMRWSFLDVFQVTNKFQDWNLFQAVTCIIKLKTVFNDHVVV